MFDESKLSLICQKSQEDEIPERTLLEMGFPIDIPAVHDIPYDALFFDLCDKLLETPFVRIGSVGQLYLRLLMQHRDASDAFRLSYFTLAPYCVTLEEFRHELERCGIESMTPETADSLCEVFIYLIETLLPRQMGDLNVDFGLKPHPAYPIFFSLAAEKLGIEVCKDHNDSRCGQLLGSTTAGAVRQILAGRSLQSIYVNTCATKRHIHSAVSRLLYYSEEGPEDAQLSLDLLKIEDALFGLSRRYRYERRHTVPSMNETFDFAVFEKNQLVLLVDYLGEDSMMNDDVHSYDVAMERTREKLEKCCCTEIPLLQFDTWELYYEDFYPSIDVRRVLRDPAYAQKRFEFRKRQLEDEEEFWYEVSDEEEPEPKNSDDEPTTNPATITQEAQLDSVMTREAFIEKIENAMDCIVFTVAGKGYTILVWHDEGISIAEWNKEETEKIYPEAKSLVDNFKVDGVPLGSLAGEININEYC